MAGTSPLAEQTQIPSSEVWVTAVFTSVRMQPRDGASLNSFPLQNLTLTKARPGILSRMIETYM